MTDELDILAKLPKPPEAGPAARARALAAAMQAFDEERENAAAEKNAAGTQGPAGGRRRNGVFNRIWSSPMLSRNHRLVGTALAVLVVAPAAAYVALELVPQTGLPGLPQPAGEPRQVAQSELPEQSPQLKSAGAEAGQQPAAQAREEIAIESLAVAPQLSESVARSVSPQDMVAAPPPAPEQGLHRQRMTSRIATAPAVAPQRPEPYLAPAEDRERFANADINPVKSVANEPVSTFSVDVDTASYAYVRRSLLEGRLPPPDSVRVEELINYFPYDWQGPTSADEPFRATVSVTPTPWNTHTQLMQVAIKGYEVAQDSAPPANIVLLIDVSGSMQAQDKLPLLKNAFRLMLSKLKPEDKVSVVTYAGRSGIVLEPTPASEREKILAAIDGLTPGGSTAGAEGIETAYRLARQAFIEGGVNRVMLATDGDFNVGASSDEALKQLIAARRKDGIFLSVLGFGRGNLNDSLMQALAQNGNGTAAYIDTLAEARKVLVEEAGSTLFPIAGDVKIQVEFNPDKIAEYRLIGYETRALRREDFNNDRVDAGDIGSGHSVTALYELAPVGSPAILNDPLRYGTRQPVAQEAPASGSGELAFVKIRYKRPNEDQSRLITTPVTAADVRLDLAAMSGDQRFATAVAAFGQKLRGDPALADYSWQSVLELARDARGEDAFGYRGNFLDLIRLAETLDRK